MWAARRCVRAVVPHGERPKQGLGLGVEYARVTEVGLRPCLCPTATRVAGLPEPIRIALVREGRMARTEKASTCSQSLCTSRFRVTYRVERQSLKIELHDC